MYIRYTRRGARAPPFPTGKGGWGAGAPVIKKISKSLRRAYARRMLTLYCDILGLDSYESAKIVSRY